MERSPAKRKKWILRLILALAAMMLIAAVLLLLGGAGLSDRYDVEAEILSGYDPSAGSALTMEPDGTLTVRMTRPDIYWYGQRYGVLDEVYRKLEAADAAAMGFRIADGRLTVYARCRTVGLPLSYRAVCAVGWEDGALVLAPEKVWLGRRISLPKSRWPDLFEEPLRLSLDSLGASVTDVRTEGDALILRLDGIRSSLSGQLSSDRGVLEALRVFGGLDTENRIVAFHLGLEDAAVPMEAARSLCLSEEDAYEALTELLAYSLPESVPSVWESRGDFLRRTWGKPLSERTARTRDELDSWIDAEQLRYEKLLTSVREMYKGGALAVGPNGFVSVNGAQPLDPASLTTLSVTATDCRIVLLYSRNAPWELCTGDMPVIDDLPRVGADDMDQRLVSGGVYDLGVTLTSEGGVPLLLSRKADGTIVLREIGEDLYVSLLVERGIPILDTDSLPQNMTAYSRPAGEGYSGAVVLAPAKND